MNWEDYFKSEAGEFTWTEKGGLREVFDQYTKLNKDFDTPEKLNEFWADVRKAEQKDYVEQKEVYAPVLKEYPKELDSMNLKVRDCVMVGKNNGKRMWMLEVEEV